MLDKTPLKSMTGERAAEKNSFFIYHKRCIQVSRLVEYVDIIVVSPAGDVESKF